MLILEKLNIIESIYKDVIESMKDSEGNSESINHVLDYCVTKLNELMKDVSSINNLQSHLVQLGKENCELLIIKIEDILAKIISRMADTGYREQSKTNFALIYFNIAQLNLAVGNYDIAFQNLEMAMQYQKDNLKDLEQLLTMKHTINQKSKSKSEKPIKPDELAQFLGDITMNKQELLTNDHFDSEYYILVKMYWMKSHLMEFKNDFTGSINNLNEIMKAIDTRYGKTNPIFLESSKKKGFAILKLTHSTQKPSGFSDLSTNSRSSANITQKGETKGK